MSTLTKTGTMPRTRRLPLFPRLPSGTFWDSLPEKDKKASIVTTGSHTSIGSKIGWNLGGLVLKHWQEILQPHIECICNNRKKAITRNTEWSITVHPFMLGSTLEDAKPTVVVTCYGERTLRRLGGLIKRDEVFQRSGFALFAWKGCFSQKAGENRAGSLPLKDRRSTAVPGVRFETRSTSGTSRIGTLGGLFVIQGEVFGVTTAHTFNSGPDSLERGSWLTANPDSNGYEVDLDTDDSFSSYSDEESDAQSHLHYDTNETYPTAKSQNGLVPSERLSVSDLISRDQNVKIGTFVNHGRIMLEDGGITERPHASMSRDWAIITMHANALFDVSPALSESLEDQWDETCNHAPEGLTKLCFPDGEKHAPGTGVTSIICLPGSETFIRTYTVHYACEGGDCGTWVRNLDSDNPYGAIIGDSSDFGLTYMVPMQDIVADIKSTWSLHSVSIGEPESSKVRLEHLEGHSEINHTKLHYTCIDTRDNIQSETEISNAAFTASRKNAYYFPMTLPGSFLEDEESSNTYYIARGWRQRRRSVDKDVSHPYQGPSSVQTFGSKNRSKIGMLDGSRPFKCNISGCNRAGVGFRTRNDLERHSRNVHDGNSNPSRRFRCPFPGCGAKIWLRYDNCRQHINRTHRTDKSQLGTAARLFAAVPSPIIHPPPAFSKSENGRHRPGDDDSKLRSPAEVIRSRKTLICMECHSNKESLKTSLEEFLDNVNLHANGKPPNLLSLYAEDDLEFNVICKCGEGQMFELGRSQRQKIIERFQCDKEIPLGDVVINTTRHQERFHVSSPVHSSSPSLRDCDGFTPWLEAYRHQPLQEPAERALGASPSVESSDTTISEDDWEQVNLVLDGLDELDNREAATTADIEQQPPLQAGSRAEARSSSIPESAPILVVLCPGHHCCCHERSSVDFVEHEDTVNNK